MIKRYRDHRTDLEITFYLTNQSTTARMSTLQNDAEGPFVDDGLKKKTICPMIAFLLEQSN